MKYIIAIGLCLTLLVSPVLAGEYWDTKHWEAKQDRVTILAEIQRYHSDNSRLYILIVILGDPEKFEAAHKYVVETDHFLRFIQGAQSMVTQYEGIEGRLTEKEAMVIVYLLECICHNQEWK